MRGANEIVRALPRTEGGIPTMVRPRYRTSLAVAAAATALGLAACGGDDSAAPNEPAPEPPVAAEPTPAETTPAESPPAESDPAPAEPTEPASDVGVSSPAADLRVALDRLLGEHANLAIVAMQKGYDGAPDFEQVAGALEENTVALGDAIGSVYGDEARDGFLELWRAHIGFFVDYTVATASDDEDGRQQALTDLAGYQEGFATFLGGANPEIDPEAIAAGLGMHVDQLTAALDSYAAGEYETAYAAVREAYAHMFGTGDALATAITAQMPEAFAS